MRRVLLAVAVVALCLVGLGSTEAGTHPDEATYLSIVSEMDDRGAWNTAWFEGEPNFIKPPLVYWAQRGLFSLFGRSLFAARLPSALSAAGLALLLGALARRMARAEPRAAAEADVGELATLLAASSLGLLRFGRLTMMDAPFALALGVGLYGAWRGVAERSPRALLWCGLGAGAAMLLKGPVGAVLVFAPAVAFAAVLWPRALRSGYAAGAVALCALIALPWFGAQLAVHGRAFVDAFFLHENLAKFSGPWTVSGELGLLAALGGLALPWTLLAGSAAASRRPWRAPAVLLPLLCVASVVFVYSLPSVKYPHYMLPCVGPAVLLTAGAPQARWARQATAGGLGLVSLGLLLALRLPFPAVGTAAVAGGAALALASAGLVFRGRLAPGALAFAAAAALVVGVAVPSINPPLFPPSALESAMGRSLVCYGGNCGLLRFATGRPVSRAWNEEHLAGSLQGGAAAVLSAADYEALAAPTRARASVSARWKRFRRRMAPADLLDAWARSDLGPLFEDMLLVSVRSEPVEGARLRSP